MTGRMEGTRGLLVRPNVNEPPRKSRRESRVKRRLPEPHIVQRTGHGRQSLLNDLDAIHCQPAHPENCPAPFSVPLCKKPSVYRAKVDGLTFLLVERA